MQEIVSARSARLHHYFPLCAFCTSRDRMRCQTTHPIDCCIVRRLQAAIECCDSKHIHSHYNFNCIDLLYWCATMKNESERVRVTAFSTLFQTFSYYYFTLFPSICISARCSHNSVRRFFRARSLSFSSSLSYFLSLSLSLSNSFSVRLRFSVLRFCLT